ncbi:MAG TPA: hypothetical protein VKA38_10410 [Draconibacterium sp.]|nr:hypothetical protein [Draconibacterium sp.]
MQQRKQNKFDNTGVGFLAGLILPMVIFLTVFFFSEKGLSFSKYIQNMWQLHALVKLGSLCVFANVLIFMGFIKLKYDKAARGVLAVTILYALGVLISRAF